MHPASGSIGLGVDVGGLAGGVEAIGTADGLLHTAVSGISVDDLTERAGTSCGGGSTASAIGAGGRR